jgi:flagellar hook-associated protein 3 FlgL
MRISTAFFTQRGLTSMLEQQGKLAEIQEQVASGKKLLRPSDDPTASAQIIRIEQTLALTSQYQRNANAVVNRLGLEESVLDNIQDSLLRIREIAVQGANSTLGNTDRLALAQEVRERLSELLSLANTRDANQEYLFSGYRSTTRPFSQSADGSFIYSGDQKQRSLQISSGRQIADSDSGNNVFVDIKNGNGTFKVDTKAMNVVAPGFYTAAVSDGTAAVQNDSGSGGAFNTVNLGVGETFSITVGGINVYNETDGGGGTDTVTAAEIDAGLTAATAALTGAGITFSGSASTGDLVFSRADGAAFNIDIVNDTATNGFAGAAEFSTVGTNAVNNGSVAIPPTDTAFTMSIDGTQFFTEAAAIGGTVTAAELDGAITAFVAGSGGAYTIESGSIATGNLLLSRADGNSVVLTIDSNFSGTVGAFSGELTSNVNSGTGTFDVGQLIDPTTYVAETYSINMVTNANGNLAYNVVGSVSGQLIPPTPQNPIDDAPEYNSGASIQFNGIQTGITGEPVVGDVFVIEPSRSQDMFTSIHQLVLALETSVENDVRKTDVFNGINTAINEIDLAFDNVTRIRTSIGARLKTTEDQISVNESFSIEMESTLSGVRDLDLAEAITELQSRLASLQAAQATFTRIQNLSLFQFIS